MKLVISLGRSGSDACLSIGAILFVCGSAVALLQTNRPQGHLMVAAHDEAVFESRVVASEAHYCPVPLTGRVLVRGRKGRIGLYHWRKDCPVVLLPPGAIPWRFITRLEAEAQNIHGCGFCRDLDEKQYSR